VNPEFVQSSETGLTILYIINGTFNVSLQCQPQWTLLYWFFTCRWTQYNVRSQMRLKVP